MHLSISHSLCSAVHNYDSLCRRSSRSPIMLSILLVLYVRPTDRASPPSRTTGAPPSIYIFILYVRPTDRPRAGGTWTRATRKRSRPDHTCKYMYTTYVYTWSKLAYCESNNASHGNDKRGYREATETPREATEAPRRPRRSPLSPTKATEIIAKTALQIPAF